MTSHVMVTLSHDHVSQWKIVEGSRRNNIIQYVIYMLTFKTDI